MHFKVATAAEDLIRATAQVGAAEIIVCTDGTCRFDGGAMFGVVPRTLWQRRVEPDEQNRVEVGLNCVVVRSAGKTVLIETGFGHKLTPKLKAIMFTEEKLPQSLAAAGIAPEQVDIVINSHLHWDHCGWNTVLDEGGRAIPYFPNATYFAHMREVEHGRRQYDRDRISYVAENYEPLIANGQMRLVGPVAPGERVPVCPGITLECFPGHTAQTMAVHIESEGEHACFASDLIPTSAHLDPTWVMAFDLDPLRTIEEKKRFIDMAIQKDLLLLFPHDHNVPIGRVMRRQNGTFGIAEERLRPDAQELSGIAVRDERRRSSSGIA